ncbi:MAG TPA: MFS transporter [Spirochaetes bacterium]|nr:MFS transporter [Spirochaetota bacterium]
MKNGSSPKAGIPAKGFATGGLRAHYTLLICSLLLMMYFINWYLFGVALEPMKKDLGFSDTQAGMIQTAFLLSIAAFSFPNSYLVDRWSRRKAIAGMAVFWSVFMYITSLGQNFWGVFIPRTLVGMGIAGFSGAAAALVSAVYPARLRARIMGIFNAALPIGAVIGVMLGGYLSARHGGWRTPFLVFSVPGILLGVLALFAKDYKTVVTMENRGGAAGFFSTARHLFGIPSLRWVYIGYGFQNVLAFTFVVWVPAYLMRRHGITEDVAGMTVGTIGLMAIIGAPLGGVLADLWQKKNQRGRIIMPSITIFIGSVMMVLSVLFDLKGIGMVFGILYGVIAIMGVPALSSITQDVVPPGLKAASWGMSVFCMYAIFGAWAPAAVGMISDCLGGGIDSLQLAIMGSGIGGLCAGLCFLRGARSYPEDLKRVQHAVLQDECSTE